MTDGLLFVKIPGSSGVQESNMSFRGFCGGPVCTVFGEGRRFRITIDFRSSTNPSQALTPVCQYCSIQTVHTLEKQDTFRLF